MQLKTDSEFTSIEWRVASVFCGLLHSADDAPGTMTPLEVVPSIPTTETLHSVINLIILVDAVNSLRKLVVAITEIWLEYYTDEH